MGLMQALGRSCTKLVPVLVLLRPLVLVVLVVVVVVAKVGLQVPVRPPVLVLAVALVQI